MVSHDVRCAGRTTSTRLNFQGINYRAEIWLNGQKIADNKQVAGMYAAHELNVTQWIKRGSRNVLAVKVTPEQLIQDVDGVELADSWFDWINWKYLGYKGPKENESMGWCFFCSGSQCRRLETRVFAGDGQRFGQPCVREFRTALSSIPSPGSRFSLICTILSTQSVNGMLKGTISRPGKPIDLISSNLSPIFLAGQDP